MPDFNPGAVPEPCPRSERETNLEADRLAECEQPEEAVSNLACKCLIKQKNVQFG
jgi:hypothetical protein